MAYDGVGSAIVTRARAVVLEGRVTVAQLAEDLKTESRAIGRKPLGNVESLHQHLSQLFGTFTYERSRAATDEQPSSLSVRSRSARKISMARAIPASPDAARP